MQNDATKKTASARSSRWIILFGLGIFLCAVIGLIFWPRQVAANQVRIGDATINVTYALTATDQAKGLADKLRMSQSEGMLFVFPIDGTYQFWMKDMRFNLDIIWLDANKKVVTIAQDVAPSSYPKLFAPTSAARYVLEVSAGVAKKSHIKIGANASFTSPPLTK